MRGCILYLDILDYKFEGNIIDSQQFWDHESQILIYEFTFHWLTQMTETLGKLCMKNAKINYELDMIMDNRSDKQEVLDTFSKQGTFLYDLCLEQKSGNPAY